MTDGSIGDMEETFAACVELGRGLDFEEGHSRQDMRLALCLFDLLADLHHLDEEDRDLLACAGLLHDIGYSEGYLSHHKTAYKLIMEADLPGLSLRQKRIVANVARYHRGALPSLDHAGFAALDPEDRDPVTILSAILRLADGLDRTHVDAVQHLDVELTDDELLVLVDCRSDCDQELWAGEKKGRFLGQVLGLEVKVRGRAQGPLAPPEAFGHSPFWVGP